MAETGAKKGGRKASKAKPGAGRRSTSGFTAEERAAMKERSRELKRGADRADGEQEVLARIAEFEEPDRTMAERVHAIVTKAAPQLTPRTWYGMPAYADPAGKVVCFFQNGKKFKTRYSTLGFQDSAKLDEGAMWPVAFALTKLTATEEKRIRALVKRAVGER